LLDLPDSEFKKLTAPDVCPLLNVGVGTDVTIRQLAETVKNVMDYNGDLIFDSSKRDVTPRELLNVDKIKSPGWAEKTTMGEGLKLTYASFLESAGKP
jgi:GDP-L-fucose synthase